MPCIRDLIGADSTVTADPLQKVSVALIDFCGLPVELIEPLENEDSPVSQGLKKGSRLQHICFSVPDIDKGISEGRKSGFHCITKPQPAEAFDQRKIAWLFHKAYGLVELVEQEEG